MTLIERITKLARETQAEHKASESSDYKWDFKAMNAKEEVWYAEMDSINKAAGKGLAVGRTLTFGVADGNANYIITKVRKNDVVVEWIPTGDFYGSNAVGLSADKTKHIVLRSTAEAHCRFDELIGA